MQVSLLYYRYFSYLTFSILAFLLMDNLKLILRCFQIILHFPLKFHFLHLKSHNHINFNLSYYQLFLYL